MIVTKKAMSRRTVLRGIGTTVALPLLDAMVPALTAVADTPAKAVPRLGVVYHPNGVIYQNWLPKGVGREFELSPILAPLAPFRDQLVVVTGLSSHQAEALGDGGGDHSRATESYLTGVHVRKSDRVVGNGVSMDQIAAKALEHDTQLSSLRLTVDDDSLVGSLRTVLDLGVSASTFCEHIPGRDHLAACTIMCAWAGMCGEEHPITTTNTRTRRYSSDITARTPVLTPRAEAVGRAM